MPARNSIKQYSENTYYHIYNRGVEKRLIFLDFQDYHVFITYLKDYLLPKDKVLLANVLFNPSSSEKEKDQARKLLRLNNFFEEITLLAYCLMPNHFHFFIKQRSATSIDRFMQSISTRYTMYFNKKYKRVGSLFQAVYKASMISTEDQFIYLSKYIHKQSFIQNNGLQQNQPSSYQQYINNKQLDWIHPEEVMTYFSKTNPDLSYQSFVEETLNEDQIILNTIEIEN